MRGACESGIEFLVGSFIESPSVLVIPSGGSLLVFGNLNPYLLVLFQPPSSQGSLVIGVVLDTVFPAEKILVSISPVPVGSWITVIRSPSAACWSQMKASVFGAHIALVSGRLSLTPKLCLGVFGHPEMKRERYGDKLLFPERKEKTFSQKSKVNSRFI